MSKVQRSRDRWGCGRKVIPGSNDNELFHLTMVIIIVGTGNTSMVATFSQFDHASTKNIWRLEVYRMGKSKCFSSVGARCLKSSHHTQY